MLILAEREIVTMMSARPHIIYYYCTVDSMQIAP
jgi:hypothetical protein